MYDFSEEPFNTNAESIRMGEDVLANLASLGTLNAFKTRNFWTSIKSAGYENYSCFLIFYCKAVPAHCADLLHCDNKIQYTQAELGRFLLLTIHLTGCQNKNYE